MSRRCSARGACQPSLILLAVAVMLFWSGGQGLWTAATNSSPTEISCAEYLQQRPTAEWLRLKGCYLDLSKARFSRLKATGTITEVYIPVLPVEKKASNEAAHIVLTTSDPAVIDLLDKLGSIDDEDEAAALVLENRDRIFQTRDIEGTVVHGADLQSKEREKLIRLGGIYKDFVLVTDGGRPTFVWSAAKIAGGFLCLGLLLLLSRRRGTPKQVEQPGIEVPAALTPPPTAPPPNA